MSAVEGTATISDDNGNLQFYTNGNIIWSNNHVPMPNGINLNGDGAATQTAIIVPLPQSLTQYYVFTVDTNGGPRGLCYSIVDMTQNGGQGDVVMKNVQLQTPVTEKLTAVRHANGIDAWIIVHGWNDNIWSAYLLTSAGITGSPVVSAVGMTHGGNFTNSHGYVKASPDAHKLACAIRGSNKSELFDLDNITGVISNPVSLGFTSQTYGIEFSPDNHYVYVGTFTNPSTITQFDVTMPAASIPASGQVIGNLAGFIGALQNGPDGKIYVCQFQSTNLACISSPNSYGMASGFAGNALSLAGKTGKFGLPNFLQSFFIIADFSYTDTCSGSPTNFTAIFAGPDSVHWDFDDFASGAANTSTLLNPQHTFSAAGQYDVELIVYQGLLNDTVRKTVNILQTPNADLGLDRSYCLGNTPFLSPGNFPGASFLWNDLTSNSTLQISSDGTYSVVVDLAGCRDSDTVNITFVNPPSVAFGTDQEICEGTPLQLNAYNTGAVYLWQDGTTDSVYNVINSGIYFVTVTVGSCVATDTINVQIDPVPYVYLGSDTVMCTGFPMFLQAGSPGEQVVWSDGTNGFGLPVNNGGVYSVTVTSGICSSRDTITIDEQSIPVIELGDDTTLCRGQVLPLDVTTYGATYLWQDGSTSPVYSPSATGTFEVVVTNQCGSDADIIHTFFQECNCQVFVPTAFSPDRDTKNEVFRYYQACEFFTATLKIYNRIGQLVFISELPEDGWDGSYNGKPATEGVYIYEIKYKAFDRGRSIKETQRGTFALVR